MFFLYHDSFVSSQPALLPQLPRDSNSSLKSALINNILHRMNYEICTIEKKVRMMHSDVDLSIANSETISKNYEGNFLSDESIYFTIEKKFGILKNSYAIIRVKESELAKICQPEMLQSNRFYTKTGILVISFQKGAKIGIAYVVEEQFSNYLKRHRTKWTLLHSQKLNEYKQLLQNSRETASHLSPLVLKIKKTVDKIFSRDDLLGNSQLKARLQDQSTENVIDPLFLKCICDAVGENFTEEDQQRYLAGNWEWEMEELKELCSPFQ
jgi:hypothetical protein